MTRSTGIEWTEHTWNPFVGCSIVSPGCTNCYAMKTAQRLVASRTAKHYEGTVRVVNRKPVWTGKLARGSEAVMRKPMKIAGRARIFVNSMSDFFHEDADRKWQAEAFLVMKACPQHQFQVLTKRPENILPMQRELGVNWPDNVWLGVTVEDGRYTWRIERLREIAVRTRFVSFEPLIDAVGPVDLTGIAWAIVGGESQDGARPMRDEWARELLHACREQGVRYFFKQHSVASLGQRFKAWGAFPPDLQVREYPD